MTPLPFDSTLNLYQKQAEELLAAWRAGVRDAVEIIRHNHPRFLDERIGWLPKDQSEDELRAAPFDVADAQLALARWYNFADWQALAHYSAAVTERGSPVWIFESAVEGVVNGDAVTLARLLNEHPDLVRVVRLLLDAGEDPNRYNPEGNHSHSTPMHQAALAGHLAVVRLLLERGSTRRHQRHHLAEHTAGLGGVRRPRGSGCLPSRAKVS